MADNSRLETFTMDGFIPLPFRCNFTTFGNNKGVDYRDQIQVNLIKLGGDERLLRLTHVPSELVLEKNLDPKKTLLRQKEKLLGMLEAALAKAELTSA